MVGYAPNALGQPTAAGTYAGNVQYHPNGAMADFIYGMVSRICSDKMGSVAFPVEPADQVATGFSQGLRGRCLSLALNPLCPEICSLF